MTINWQRYNTDPAYRQGVDDGRADAAITAQDDLKSLQQIREDRERYRAERDEARQQFDTLYAAFCRALPADVYFGSGAARQMLATHGTDSSLVLEAVVFARDRDSLNAPGPQQVAVFGTDVLVYHGALDALHELVGRELRMLLSSQPMPADLKGLPPWLPLDQIGHVLHALAGARSISQAAYRAKRTELFNAIWQTVRHAANVPPKTTARKQFTDFCSRTFAKDDERTAAIDTLFGIRAKIARKTGE